MDSLLGVNKMMKDCIKLNNYMFTCPIVQYCESPQILRDVMHYTVLSL